MDTWTRRLTVNFSNPAVGLPEPRNRDNRLTVNSSNPAVGMSELGDEDAVPRTDAVSPQHYTQRKTAKHYQKNISPNFID